MTFHADSVAKQQQQQQQQQPDSASFTLSQVWQRAMLRAGLVPLVSGDARVLCAQDKPPLDLHTHRTAHREAVSAGFDAPAQGRRQQQPRRMTAAASAHDGCCCMLRCQALC